MPGAYPAHRGNELEGLCHRAHLRPLSPPLVTECDLRGSQLALAGNPGTVFDFDQHISASIPHQQIGNASPYSGKVHDRAANGPQRGDYLAVVRIAVCYRPAASHYRPTVEM